MKVIPSCSVALLLISSCCSNNHLKSSHDAFKEVYLKSLANEKSHEYVDLVYRKTSKHTDVQMTELARAHHALKRDMADMGIRKITEAKFEYIKELYTEPLENDEVRMVYDYYNLDLNEIDYYSSRIIFYAEGDMVMTWFLYFVEIGGEYFVLIPPDDIRIIKKLFTTIQ